jgi:hypothetical protein
VLAAGEGAESGLDLLPALLILERPAYGLADEAASPSSPDAFIELSYESIVEANV